MQDNDWFGVPESAFAVARKTHESALTMRCGVYVPNRAEVCSEAPETSRSLLIEWRWESPSELIPTDEHISQVKAELEARPDADALAVLIDECRQYIGSVG